MERRVRQQREEHARWGAVPRDRRGGGPAGEFLRSDDTRGRGEFSLQVERTCQEVQAVFQVVRRVPGVGLRKPFTIPARSKYICMCCSEAKSNVDIFKYFFFGREKKLIDLYFCGDNYVATVLVLVLIYLGLRSFTKLKKLKIDFGCHFI